MLSRLSFRSHLGGCWVLSLRLFAQLDYLIGSFPCEIGIVAAKVPVPGSLAIDRPAQFQRFDDALRLELEVLAPQLFEFGFVDLAGVEGVDQNATRISHADGVCQLNFAAVGETG